MRHRVSGRKLNRTMEHRRALLRNMVTSLILEERIETTLAKAKELRRVADRMVTLGKRGTLHARRRALSYVRTNEAVQKLFSELAKRFSERNGGYTRVLKIGDRNGDSAPMALIEYVGAPLKPSKAERRKVKAEARKQLEEEARKAKPKKAKEEKKKPLKKEKKKVAAPEVMEEAQKKSAKKVKAEAKRPAPQAQKKKGIFGRVLGRRSNKP